MASRPTHERRDTDAEIVPVVPQSQSDNSHEDSRSQKSGFSSEKEAREDGLKSISQTESFDEEHAKNQQQGVTRIEALYRVYGNNRVAIWSLYISLACEWSGCLQIVIHSPFDFDDSKSSGNNS